MCLLLLHTSVFAKNVTLKEFFVAYYTHIAEWIPSSYQYINLEYTNVPEQSDLYVALQKAVYLNLLPNKAIRLPLDKPITESIVENYVRKDLRRTFETKQWQISTARLTDVISQLPHYFDVQTKWQATAETKQITLQENFSVLNDIFTSLTQEHVYNKTIEEKELLYGAIHWMIEKINDPYTIYYEPEQDYLQTAIAWEFEGIWAYLDVDKEWYIIILSTVPGSPAEAAWLQKSDILLSVDWVNIQPFDGIESIIKKITWPAWTSVDITIQRQSQNWTDTQISMSITRKKVILDHMKATALENNTRYIDINLFSSHVAEQFDDLAIQLNKDNIQTLILDVRDNPWGFLDVADSILYHFVPQDKPTIHVKWANPYDLNSRWTASNAFLGDKRIIILANEWSASASEIIAWTIKDYYPQTTIIWTQSFGKWTMQKVVEYSDWSMFKFTIAQWCTGKSRICINGIGLSPDIQIQDNNDTVEDEVLQKALDLIENPINI